jgi:hypothetical protein
MNHSQNYESEILKDILSKILFKFPNYPSYIEFGAHDGITNSNLRFLAEEGHKGIFLEGDKRLFARLLMNINDLPITPIYSMLDTKDNTLDKVLKSNNINSENITILSIDIDSDDARIFETVYWPLTAVIIEYNPTIPFDSEFVQPVGRNWGNSAKSILEIGEQKNLFLVAITETNLILLNNDYRNIVPEISIFDNHKLHHQLRFALGYDGSILLFNRRGENFTKEVLPLGWTRASFVQPLPKIFRKFKKMEKLKVLYSILKISTRFTAYGDIYRYVRKKYK